MSAFVSSVCEALPEFSPEEVQAAIPVVKAGKYLPKLVLINCVRDYLTPQPVEDDRQDEFTEIEWQEIMRAIRDDCQIRTRQNINAAREMRELNAAMRLFEVMEDRIKQQEVLIESLLDYIASCPLSSEIEQKIRRSF